MRKLFTLIPIVLEKGLVNNSYWRIKVLWFGKVRIFEYNDVDKKWR